MDKIEGGPLAQVPPAALKLALTRSTIKMQHSSSWSIDKMNPVDDLLICTGGRGDYLIEGQHLWLNPGEAMLIPRGTPFVGWNTGAEVYTGIAQHFTLSIFGETDLLAQLSLRRKVSLNRWDELAPLVAYFRQTAPPSSVTLAQHHTFMIFLLAFIDDAFLDWRDQKLFNPTKANMIDIAVTVAASRIAADPFDEGIAQRVVAEAAFNPEYFLRAFKARIGRTPRQFLDFKVIERAMSLLETGKSVADTGAAVGFSDPYYFSRKFKQIVGVAPREHLRMVKETQDGSLVS